MERMKTSEQPRTGTISRIGKRQCDVIEWALDVMPDYWCSEDNAHERDSATVYDEHDLPRVEIVPGRKNGHRLHVGHVPAVEIIEDLLYRLEEQLPDMGDDDEPGWREDVRAAASVAARIRAAYEDVEALPQCDRRRLQAEARYDAQIDDWLRAAAPIDDLAGIAQCAEDAGAYSAAARACEIGRAKR